MINRMKAILGAFLLGSAMVLSGCASVPMAPAEQDTAAKQFQAPADKARLYVYRNESFGAAIAMPVSLGPITPNITSFHPASRAPNTADHAHRNPAPDARQPSPFSQSSRGDPKWPSGAAAYAASYCPASTALPRCTRSTGQTCCHSASARCRSPRRFRATAA